MLMFASSGLIIPDSCSFLAKIAFCISALRPSILIMLSYLARVESNLANNCSVLCPYVIIMPFTSETILLAFAIKPSSGVPTHESLITLRR